MAEEYEKFEITDYDLENEFNPNRHRKKHTKNQQIYGKKIMKYFFSKFSNFFQNFQEFGLKTATMKMPLK